MLMKRFVLLAALILMGGPAFGQAEPAPLNVYYGQIPEGKHTFFVAPDGANAAVGSEAAPWATLDYAITKVQRGDVIVMRGGVYEHSETINIKSPSGYIDELIVVTAYPGEVPILEFAPQPDERNYHGIRLNANWWHLIGLTIRHASHNGIRMDGSYNVLEQITAYENYDTGIHMAGGASNNLIKNCDSFRNYDSPVGGNADGFSAKFDGIGTGNRYVGDRAWENSDDGWDFWMAPSAITIDSSWAFSNGDAEALGNLPQFDGNGNGFKLGGNYIEADHVVRHSMAFDNLGPDGRSKGFDYNNNPGAMTLIANTAYNNGRNFIFPLNAPSGNQAAFINNLSVAPSQSQHATTPSTAVFDGNIWLTSTGPMTNVFQSVDIDQAKAPRQRDGSLPDIELLRPAPGSFIVDAGVLTGAPFYGDAPDVGAFELAVGERVQPWANRAGGSVIGGLRVFDLNHAAAWNVHDAYRVGVQPFDGASFTVSDTPAGLRVDEWIQTPLAARAMNYLYEPAEVTATVDGKLFVAHAAAITPKPEWLSAFERTDLHLTLAGGSAEHLMDIYVRDVSAGDTLALGRNSRDGAEDAPMYFVLFGDRVAVGVEPDPAQQEAFVWRGIYPNPVRSTANVSFNLAQAADVSVKMYDALGREVAVLADGFMTAGPHTLAWNAGSATSGVYFCRIEAGKFSVVKRVVRL